MSISFHRGVAHNECNLNYTFNFSIVVIFHHPSSCDANFLIKQIFNSTESELKIIRSRSEKYISFTKKIVDTEISIRFIDISRFMNCSLEKQIVAD